MKIKIKQTVGLQFHVFAYRPGEVPWGRKDDSELSRQLGTRGSFVLFVFFFPAFSV